MEMTHLVMFSGGVGSWLAAKRVVAAHGTHNTVLVFADTRTEDEDLYRFVLEAAQDAGGRFVVLADGRDVWDVYRDTRYIGNTRIDPCSRVLKRDLIRNWMEECYTPATARVYLGIDWTEKHRLVKARPHWEPWEVEAPLTEPPHLDKLEMFKELKKAGITLPRLYEMGFPHNNCGGFCCKAGHAQFKLLLSKMPERYAYHEQKEQELRDYLEKDVAILRCRRKESLMLRLGKKKGCFPRTMGKWCTTILKIEPIQGWFQTLPEGDYVVVTGLRAAESPNRAKAAPYVEEDPLYHCPRWPAIFDWTTDEVFYWLRQIGVDPNPLYAEGFTRVGCFPCIYARKNEIRLIAENYPGDIERVRNMEEAAEFTFFHYDKVPERFRKDGLAPIDVVALWSKWNRGEPDPPELSINQQEDLDSGVCDLYGFCG